MKSFPTETEAVYNLQTYLRQLSYHNSEITPPTINGVFDSLTRQALSQFQKGAGLPVSGTATKETWTALYAAYCQSISENALPVKISVFPPYPPTFCIKPGHQGFCVTALQYLLRELQAVMSENISIELTGIYDAATERAVRAFQSCCSGLSDTGTVDRATWNAIAARYNALFDRWPEE